MDGLRLALIIAGIAVVAAVYFWTARRRRAQREAGEFDSFGAWTDAKLDPLSDRDAQIQINPRARANALDTDASADDPNVLQGLEAIARSPDDRAAPHLGQMDEVDEPPPAVTRQPPARPTPPAPAPARAMPPRRASAPRAAARTPAPAEAGGGPDLTVVLNVMAPEGERFSGLALRQALDNAGLEPGDMQLYHYRAQAQPADAPPIFSALNAVKPGTLDPAEMDALHTPGVALVLRLPGLERPSEAFELMHGVAVQMAAELGGRLCDETRSTLTRQALNHVREQIADAVRRRRLGGP